MDNKKIVLKGHVLYPQGMSEGQDFLEIEDGLITLTGENGAIFFGPEYQIYDFGPNYICPGFIDLHVHGCGGADVMDGTYEALDSLSLALAKGGTTSFLATTISAPHQALVEAVKAVALTRQKGMRGAQVLGVHLEGPFLNKGQKGAHKEEYLRLPNIDVFKEYIDAGNGAVRMITIAPELTGSTRVIEFARSRGLTVSLGHSDASITQVEEASRIGLTHVTHAFNSMPRFHHRDPGTTGAIMSMKQLTADVIPDGHHVHPSVIKILVHSKGIDRVCAITDCIRAGQMGDGVFELGGQRVTVRNGIAQLDDGTISGSTISMAQAVKVMVEQVGLTLIEAVQLAVTNPGKILGLDDRGRLEPGKRADIVVLDHHLNVLMTIVGGKIVYKQ
ncbi:MAG: N-acetylglucosamine-6-phosphate deacetylase [Firmicutes bacterium]|nr:N-acetylglucosamine-6-phosphate deacetylase [Bacillota bacterium]